MQIDRRRFLTLGAGTAAAAALAACTSDDGSAGSNGGTSVTTRPGNRNHPLGNPKDAPFDHVVILMMENRSFDHLLGWLPGANGKQAGLSYPDLDGRSHPTWDNGD